MAEDLSSKSNQDGLDASGASKIDMKNETQPPADNKIQLVKPKVTMEPMTTNVTIEVSAIELVPGNMAVITTTEGQLIVPAVGFANGMTPNPVQNAPEGTTVVVNAAYARSQGLI